MRIELFDVKKSFGLQQVLRGVNLTLESCEHVALVGPNGSGKSTLLRIVMGMLRSEGSVSVDGRIPFKARREIAKTLAYVPQVAPLLSVPVGELIDAVTSLRQLSGLRVAEVAQELGLKTKDIEAKPFRTLSGGMKQKLLLAIAFSTDARLMIFDEPTASLDVEARERCLELLDERSRSSTLILCSHHYEEMQNLVSRVVELQDGIVARDFSALTASQDLERRRKGSGTQPNGGVA